MVLKSLLIMMLSLGLLSGCINSTPSSARKAGSSSGLSKKGTPSGSGTGQGAQAGADDTTTDTTSYIDRGIPELRHLIDPFDGTYKTKLTVPKNLSGYLYVSGLNVTSLRDKLVKVRFKFGRELEPITIDATVSRAPGIIPQTDIEVLILDLSTKPFENMRLSYDLFDYNSYDATSTIVKDPRDGGLFCRGLDLAYDPTHGDSTEPCSGATSVCKYAYAKILDSGLTYSGVAKIPTEPQIDFSKSGYGNDSIATSLKKCLPDNNVVANITGVLASTGTVTMGSSNYGTDLTINTSTYTYYGPFRTSNSTDWQITSNAVFSSTGLFGAQLSGATGVNGGYNSYLFPRAGKMSLNAGVEHFSSVQNFDTRALLDGGLVTAGETDYMDGCNLRVTNYDAFSNEGIGSCNVTSEVEILRVDADGNEEILASSSQLKLQLIKPSLKDSVGREVLYTSMKTCSASSACGANECCYNQRCWSKEIVSQCLEDVNSLGNFAVGQTCSTDYQCSSLCCNQATGRCAVHDNTLTTPVLCSKSPGQTCVAREWCREENVMECKVVKTGLDPQGAVTCALRCYNKQVHGLCTNGSCTMPPVPAVPAFDPTNPDCSGAVDPL